MVNAIILTLLQIEELYFGDVSNSSEVIQLVIRRSSTQRAASLNESHRTQFLCVMPRGLNFYEKVTSIKQWNRTLYIDRIRCSFSKSQNMWGRAR